MAKKRALVFTTIQGHKSISDTLVQILQQHDWEVHSTMYVDPVLVIYRWIYWYAPALCKYYYFTLFLPGVEHIVRFYTKRTHGAAFRKTMREHTESDLLISASYGYDSLITEWKKRMTKEGKKSPAYVNVVVDPRTFFLVNLSATADQNLVFNDTIARSCRKLKPKAPVAVTGWFVRPQFRSQTPKQEARQALGLEANKLTLLFVAGSEGETKSAKLIPTLLDQNTPTQIILACGNNAKLKAEFDKLAACVPASSAVTLYTLPFTKEIHKYMRAADLIVGKAGPNMIFEAVASETPFFATAHISGQEDGNLELIREYGIGYVEENLEKAASLLRKIAAHPQQLEQFTPHLKALAAQNDQAPARFIDVVQALT